MYSWRVSHVHQLLPSLSMGGAGVQLEMEGRSWCTVREGGGAGVQLEREGRGWCTVREGGEELVYSN